jgi:hypothetical protein
MSERMKMIEKLVQASLLVAEAREMTDKMDSNSGTHGMVVEVENEIKEHLDKIKDRLYVYPREAWE